MTSIVELFPKCRKLAYDSRQQLSQIQNGALQSPSEMLLSLDELNRQLDMMDALVIREQPSQRQVWKRKILELREDCNNLYQQYNYYDQRQRNSISRYHQEREELLLRRRKNATPASRDEQDLGNLADEAQSLQSSQNMISDIISQGESSLNSLIDQRSSLRGITRTVLDMSNRLGLTNSTMRIIERRDITDAYLVAAGMVITCLVIYFVWF